MVADGLHLGETGSKTWPRLYLLLMTLVYKFNATHKFNARRLSVLPPSDHRAPCSSTLPLCNPAQGPARTGRIARRRHADSSPEPARCAGSPGHIHTSGGRQARTGAARAPRGTSGQPTMRRAQVEKVDSYGHARAGGVATGCAAGDRRWRRICPITAPQAAPADPAARTSDAWSRPPTGVSASGEVTGGGQVETLLLTRTTEREDEGLRLCRSRGRGCTRRNRAGWPEQP